MRQNPVYIQTAIRSDDNAGNNDLTKYLVLKTERHGVNNPVDVADRGGDVLRMDVGTAGDNNRLLAAGYGEEAIGIDTARSPV